MDRIIPISELRNHLAETCNWIEEERRPIILTKNGRGRFVMLDIDSYNDLLGDGSPTAPSQPMSDHRPRNADTGRTDMVGQADAQPASSATPSGPIGTRLTPPASNGIAAEADAVDRREGYPGMSDAMREEEDRILRELGLL